VRKSRAGPFCGCRHRALGDTNDQGQWKWIQTRIQTPGENDTRAAGDAGAFEALAHILDQQITPVYQRCVSELGLGPEAFAGLKARTEELRALRRQIGSGLFSLLNEKTATSERWGRPSVVNTSLGVRHHPDLSLEPYREPERKPAVMLRG
jgi:hypothetical protein